MLYHTTREQPGGTCALALRHSFPRRVNIIALFVCVFGSILTGPKMGATIAYIVLLVLIALFGWNILWMAGLLNLLMQSPECHYCFAPWLFWYLFVGSCIDWVALSFLSKSFFCVGYRAQEIKGAPLCTVAHIPNELALWKLEGTPDTCHDRGIIHHTSYIVAHTHRTVCPSYSGLTGLFTCHPRNHQMSLENHVCFTIQIVIYLRP